MSRPLLASRRFAPIFWCQFLSALNDNFVKNALVILILYRIGGENAPTLVTLAGTALILPFFFLSALGGELADKFDKAQMARWIKLAEIPIAGIAAAGFIYSSVELLFLSLFLFGSAAALFGPIKYGILPDHLETRELPAANALVEGATFLAILIGTITGGLAVAGHGDTMLVPPSVLAIIMLTLAGFGWLSARFIMPTGRAAPDLRISVNPLSSTFRLLRELRADRRLWVGGLITSWFWLAGIVALSLLPSLIKTQIGGSEDVVTLTLVVFTIGIASGSWMAARASRHRPNLALVPIGALAMGLSAIAVAVLVTRFGHGTTPVTPATLIAMPSGLALLVALFALSASGGLFVVPSFAAVQSWAAAERRARVVAAVNVLNAVFMAAGTMVTAGLQVFDTGISELFGLLGAANIIVAVFVLRAWGRDGLKDLAAFVFGVGYSLEVKGRENLPKPGARAIITPNHVSMMDGPVLHSIMPDHAAFAIDTGIAKAWWVAPFLKLINAYTLDPTRPLATRQLVNEVKAGKTLVIFPEGRLTVTGGLMKVYDGTALIADKADAEVIPVRIDGLERTPWSYLRKSQTRKVTFPKVTVTILPPRKLVIDPALRGKARRQAAGAALQDIMVDTAVETANLDRTLFEALTQARDTRDTGKVMVEDPLGTKLTYKRLILGAQVLGAKLAGTLATTAPVGASVGVLLPNTAGVAVTFFALQSIGRVPAMLNYTAGAVNMLAACKAAKVDVILTSRAFIEKAKLEDVEKKLATATRLIYLEDIRARITFWDKLAGLRRGARPLVNRKADDPAAILFTSGSEGMPKGVALSHRNMLANSIQALSRIAAHGDDKVFNVLPVFHSFGLTAGLVMPLVGGVPLYLYPSPLHYRIVPELVYQTNATILFGTDTFLNGYARAAHPYDFHNVRLILAGAEAVKQRTRDTYMDRFGVRILEGYGVTETAPVIAFNTPLANKAGTVGRLLPLIEARLEPVAGIEGERTGRLFVRGPNVMLGYYRVENPGVLEPPPNGWHDTGDIVQIDAQGFVAIKGRAKRFAKIGGEMVSLSAVEDMAANLWPGAVSVVVAQPDLRKGERLALVTTDTKANRADFLRHAKRIGASELVVPAEFLIVPHVPLLGSGKPDYVATAKLAAEKSAAPAKQVGPTEDIPAELPVK